MRKIYCISGLGADGRVFQKLKIKDAELVFVPWPDYDPHDDMACYAQKLRYLIKDENPTIIGVSFGGMLTTEMAKQSRIAKSFIISSARTPKELPFAGRFFRFIVRSKILPVGLFKGFHKPINDRFGVETEEEEQLLESIIDATDNGFMRWSMKAMLNWKSEEIPTNIVHIHGTNDKMIPPGNVKADHWINKGSHFMVYNRADEVSKLINQYL